MLYKTNESVFDKFFKQKESLIIQFKNGDLSKREFINENYNYVINMGLKPFKNIDSFEKGIYTYHYYNILAKQSYMVANDIKDKGKHPHLYKKHLEKANNYYHQKDKTTLRILRIIDFTNVEAYYVKVKSSYLKGKLYEIILLDYNNTVLHSKSEWLKNILIDEKIFNNNNFKSMVDNYINEKY